MIPARERNAVDWGTANRLTQENKDFLSYIRLVRQFYQTGEIRQDDWEAVQIEAAAQKWRCIESL